LREPTSSVPTDQQVVPVHTTPVVGPPGGVPPPEVVELPQAAPVHTPVDEVGMVVVLPPVLPIWIAANTGEGT
jgi:hypothetical protein